MPEQTRSDDEVRGLVREILDPYHQINRKDIHDLRGKFDLNANRVSLVEMELQGLRKDFGKMELTVDRLAHTADRFEALVNKEAGRQEARADFNTARDGKIARGSMWAMWAAVMATIGAALLGALVAYVLATHNPKSGKLFSSDPTIAQGEE